MYIILNNGTMVNLESILNYNIKLDVLKMIPKGTITIIEHTSISIEMSLFKCQISQILCDITIIFNNGTMANI